MLIINFNRTLFGRPSKKDYYLFKTIQKHLNILNGNCDECVEDGICEIRRLLLAMGKSFFNFQQNILLAKVYMTNNKVSDNVLSFFFFFRSVPASCQFAILHKTFGARKQNVLHFKFQKFLQFTHNQTLNIWTC